jgi:hypothetical protein
LTVTYEVDAVSPNKLRTNIRFADLINPKRMRQQGIKKRPTPFHAEETKKKAFDEFTLM